MYNIITDQMAQNDEVRSGTVRTISDLVAQNSDVRSGGKNSDQVQNYFRSGFKK